MPPICVKERDFIMNATVDDAAFDVSTEKSSVLYERRHQRVLE